MSKLDWQKANDRERAREAGRRAPYVRDDYVSPAERHRVLAIAEAFPNNRFCRDIIERCGEGIGRGITQAQAEMVYRIAREQQGKVTRRRGGNAGARDYQRRADFDGR